MAVTKYESYYAKISENIKGIREYNEYNTDSLAGECPKVCVNLQTDVR